MLQPPMHDVELKHGRKLKFVPTELDFPELLVDPVKGHAFILPMQLVQSEKIN